VHLLSFWLIKALATSEVPTPLKATNIPTIYNAQCTTRLIWTTRTLMESSYEKLDFIDGSPCEHLRWSFATASEKRRASYNARERGYIIIPSASVNHSGLS
jgi:hypothetical protein